MTNKEKHLCAERELKMRERVYPRLVERGQMTDKQGVHEIMCMMAISDDYRRLAEKDRLI